MGAWNNQFVADKTNPIKIRPTNMLPNKRSDNDNILPSSPTSSINQISNPINISPIFAKNVQILVTLGTIPIQ